VPDHPQNSRKADIVTQQAATDRQWRLLSRFTHADSTYMEIGAGDCHLAMAIAQRARFSYAIDVSDVIASGNQRPKNFAMIVSDGIHVGVPAGAVDVAYSNQLMEHLHPDDAADQLREICKSLAPGGRYICVTPHRFSGPHDISRFFAPEARGFHLKEYTYGELRQLFLAAGFDSTSIWTGLAGRFFPIPQPIVLGIEKLLGLLPRAIQKRLTRWAPARPVFINVLLVGNRSRRPAATTSSAAPDGPVVKVKAA
jgi:SAM-dependent methyltransferase